MPSRHTSSRFGSARSRLCGIATPTTLFIQSYPTRKLSWLIRDCRQWPLPNIARDMRPRACGTPGRRMPRRCPKAFPAQASAARPHRPRWAVMPSFPFSPTPPSPRTRPPSGSVQRCAPASPARAGHRGPGASAHVTPAVLGMCGRACRGRPPQPCGTGVRWARTAILPSSRTEVATVADRRSAVVRTMRRAADSHRDRSVFRADAVRSARLAKRIPLVSPASSVPPESRVRIFQTVPRHRPKHSCPQARPGPPVRIAIFMR